ncbi:MAG: hypothetical protein IE927_08705 [Rhodobacterales bacterium]|nr:hypothetical protein [Rhodobacterales bacterium]
MIGHVEAPRAYWQTCGMARAVGVNLPGAVLEGWLKRDELDGMVRRCQRCSRLTDCTAWLAAARRERLPAYCPNKAEIEALSPQT